MSTILFVYISVEFKIPAVGRCQWTLLLFIGNSNPFSQLLSNCHQGSKREARSSCDPRFTNSQSDVLVRVSGVVYACYWCWWLQILLTCLIKFCLVYWYLTFMRQSPVSQLYPCVAASVQYCSLAGLHSYSQSGLYLLELVVRYILHSLTYPTTLWQNVFCVRPILTSGGLDILIPSSVHWTFRK